MSSGFRLPFMVVALFFLVSCVSKKTGVVDAQQAQPGGTVISKVAVLPLQTPLDMPNRIRYERNLREQICVHLLIKGYDVIYPEEVDRFLKNRPPNETESALRRILAAEYDLDAVITGSFDLHIDNYIIATKGSISSEIVFRDPKTGEPLLTPFRKSDMELDPTILAKIATIPGSEIVSSALKALLLIINESMEEYPTTEEKNQRFISYLAHSILKDVPQGPGLLGIPKQIDFAMTPVDKPFGFGDEIKLHIMTGGNLSSGSPMEFVARLGDPEGITIDLPFHAKPGFGRIWEATHRFHEEDLVWRRAPVSIFFKKQGRRFFLGTVATIDVKTTAPVVPELHCVKEAERWCFLWSGTKQQGITYRLWRKSGADDWKCKATLKDPARLWYCPEAQELSDGTVFKITATDWAGNRSESKALLVSLCAQKTDIFFMISSDSKKAAPCFKAMVKAFEDKLITRLRKLGKTFQTQDARCAQTQYYFHIYPQPCPGGFQVCIEDALRGAILHRGHWCYGTKDPCEFGIARSDATGIMACLAHLFPIDTPTASEPEPVSPKYPLVCSGDSAWMSLAEAESICREEGGRLLTAEEWYSHQADFAQKQKSGEYVVDGRMYFDATDRQWRYEHLYQRHAANPCCVRCKIGNPN